LFRVTMSSRGQVVIPAELRRRLGLSPGSRLHLHESGAKVILVPEMADPVGEGLGFLRKTVTGNADRDLREDRPGSGGSPGAPSGATGVGDPADSSTPSDAGFVIGSSALLAYLRGDEGGAIVQRVLQQCRDCETRAVITASDLLEAYAAPVEVAPSVLQDLVSLIDQLPLDACPVTGQTAARAAELVAADSGLKPSQALALVLAVKTGSTLVTADRELSGRAGCLYVGSSGGSGGNPGT
jgi:AbrB family looped-hinge helix DNA binding protein